MQLPPARAPPASTYRSPIPAPGSLNHDSKEERMAEQTWTEEHILASDLWGRGEGARAREPGGASRGVEASRRGVGRPRQVRETLRNDPLLLALSDAMIRAQEELARAEDRLSRPEGAELHPCEHERLRGCATPMCSGTRIQRSTRRNGRTTRSRSGRSRSWRACGRRLPSTCYGRP